MPGIITVRQLNTYVRSVIEGDSRLNNVAVCGEISNLKNHYASGHVYFTLKDNDALIRCVMFKQNALRLAFSANDGERVVCTGKITLYEKDGQYQFVVDSMVREGAGDLAEKFRLIKEKLEKEGLFAPETKRPLPKFPRTVSVVTSQSGAALQDILNIISRRYPLCCVTVSPVLVQGEGAARSIIEALNNLYELGRSDVIIVGRGGGSAEDLSAFNDELLARTVYESPVPIISAVGHETDFTICDFVADLRAPTPSAAAELAVPDIADIKAYLINFNRRLIRGLEFKFSAAQVRLSKAMQSIYMVKPQQIVEDRRRALQIQYEALVSDFAKTTNNADLKFKTLAAKLDAQSPLKTLSRGYAVVNKNGQRIRKTDDVLAGDTVNIILSDGSFSAEVTEVDYV